MDEFRIKVGPRSSAGAIPLEIVLNGESFIDLVRRLEEPLVAAELQSRIAAGEPEAELASLRAGAYSYPTVADFQRNGGGFFGSIESLFALTERDPHRGMTCLLGCDCGEVGCWPFLTRIRTTGTVVTWRDFAQFHRDWSYKLGPYHFARAAYEAEMHRVAASNPLCL